MSIQKNEKRYKIGDVCKLADVQPYVLRYWETEFPALAPDKTGGGQRTYTQLDVDVILRIKELLYAEGFTIAGAKKKLEAELKDGGEPGPKPPQPAAASAAAPAAAAPAAPSPKAAKILGEVKDELRSILRILEP